MSTDGKKIKTFIQCQTCGRIYRIPQAIPIEKLYVLTNCPDCGVTTGLNLGDNKEDVYLYMNNNLDSRYYNY